MKQKKKRKRILKEIPEIERDETGRPIGISVDEFGEKLKNAIAKHYKDNP